MSMSTATSTAACQCANNAYSAALVATISRKTGGLRAAVVAHAVSALDDKTPKKAAATYLPLCMMTGTVAMREALAASTFDADAAGTGFRLQHASAPAKACTPATASI